MRLIQPVGYQVLLRKQSKTVEREKEHENDLSSELMDDAGAHLSPRKKTCVACFGSTKGFLEYFVHRR